MSGVDNRIVTMQFNNAKFEQNARTSLSTLQKLKESMNFGSIVGSAVRGLGAIDSALGKLGLKTPFSPLIKTANAGLGLIGGTLDKIGLKNPFASGVQGASELQRAAQTAGGPAGMGVLEGGVTAVSSKFIALTTIAVTALANITNRAVNAGLAFGKSFTVQPILDGLHEYETNLKAIQTVQANTDRPLPEINKALEQLNRYSDQTIYNFGEMAKNVGTFTAAGVDLETSVASIKGIANLAALSGSSSEQAATAMYQLSQAIASGRVGLMDWNSVVNAGMGGKKLQNALAQTAVAMGEIGDQAVKMDKQTGKLTINGQSFRESIMAKPGEKPWLTSEALTNTLASMDGRFSRAALGAEKLANGTKKYNTAAEITNKINKARAELEKKNGVKYTDEQFKALQKMSTSAFEAATKVKTLSQVFQVARETIGSGWSASFKSIFGNLKQAKKLFTGMSTGLTDIINQNALARNNLLADWNKGGGRASVIDGLATAWHAVYDIIKAVGAGFRDIFPKKSADDLIGLSEAFQSFAERLTPSLTTLINIKRIAGGFFSIFSIGATIISAVAAGFKALFGELGGGQGNFLSFAAGVADTVTNFALFLKTSGVVTSFFVTLGQVLAIPLSILKGVGGLIAGLFGGFDKSAADGVTEGLAGIGNRLSGLEVVGERVRTFFENVGEFFGNLGTHIGKALVGIGDLVAAAFTPETFGSTLDVINTTLLGGLVLLIRNFFKGGANIDLTGGLFDGIKETLGSVTSAFENMQQNLKANILLKLAGAIGVMALALLVLSTIDPAALTKALAAMTGGFAILIGAMATLLKVMGPAGLVQLYVVTTAMSKMALSILLLSFALKTLAGIKFGDMLRGLTGLGIMMFILIKAMAPLAANSAGMAKASFSLILVGIALNILALALKVFATMSWEEMAKGLAGLTGTLIALAIGLKLMPPLQAQAIGLIALGAAINLIAIALKVMATMSWEEMAKGLLTLTAALLIISLAINTMPKTMLLQAAALLVVSAALVVLGGALKIMGSMGWEEIGKGLLTLAVSMLILAVGLNAIGATGILGAAALLVTAAALAVLVPVLITLGSLKWATIFKALVALSLIFVVLGVAGYLLAPIVPVLLGLAAALLLFGAAVLVTGAGVFLIATAIGILVTVLSAGAQILIGFLISVIATIPAFMKALATGLVLMAVTIGTAAPILAAAFGNVLLALINKGIQLIPKIGQLILTLVGTILRIIVNAGPKIANAGLKLLLGFLRAIRNNLSQVISVAGDIVVKFISGMARQLPRIVEAGVRFILKFITGLTKTIDSHSEEFGRKGAELGLAIVTGMAKGVLGASSVIKDAALAAAKKAFQAVKDFFGIKSPSRLMRDEIGRRIPQGMAEGIKSDAPQVVREMSNMGQSAMSTITAVMDGVNSALSLNPNMSPTVTPVLDLTALTQEANKMSSILATAPIMAAVSYQTAADISALTTAPSDPANGGGTNSPEDSSGTQTIVLEQHLHSPKPIDSVEAYRAGKTLISLAKEALK